MPRRRPLRYRGIRLSRKASRALTAFWIVVGVGLLVAVGVVAAFERSGNLPVPIVVGIGVLWAAGMAFRFRRIGRDL
jgi:hypothetical protein